MRLIKKLLDFNSFKQDRKMWWIELSWQFSNFLQYTPPFSWIGKVTWWLKYRFHPSHRYTIIDTRLKPGYYDRDYILLVTSFAILCDFIEKELPWSVLESDKVPWYMSNKRYVKKNAQELAFQYLDGRMKLRMKYLDNGQEDPNSDLQVNHEETCGWAAKEIMQLYIWWKYERDQEHNYDGEVNWKVEFDLDEKDDKQLIRLAKIRGHLWT
jgi:hypothetical protein